jgi:hypothetical protein
VRFLPKRRAVSPAEPGGAISVLVQPDPEVVKTVTDAYYTRSVAAADAERSRAQQGYTIGSAISAALVAAGVFAHLDTRPVAVQVLGLLALILWLGAALLYIWTVSVPINVKPPKDGWPDAGAFVTGVKEMVDTEVTDLRTRQHLAVLATCIAVVLTVATLAFATAEPGGAQPEKARVTLTPTASAALTGRCPTTGNEIDGVVDPDHLGNDVVDIAIPAGECGRDATTLDLPKSEIVVVQKIVRFPSF